MLFKSGPARRQNQQIQRFKVQLVPLLLYRDDFFLPLKYKESKIPTTRFQWENCGRRDQNVNESASFSLVGPVNDTDDVEQLQWLHF
jgi:hypothetical protein